MTSGMNREISLIFENLPDKRDLPDYYAAIKNPISLSEIEVSRRSRLVLTYRNVCLLGDTTHGKNSSNRWSLCVIMPCNTTRMRVTYSGMLSRSW